MDDPVPKFCGMSWICDVNLDAYMMAPHFFFKRYMAATVNPFVAVLVLILMGSPAHSAAPQHIKKSVKPVPSIGTVDAAVTSAQLLIAQRVEVGRVACELGAFVSISADAQMPGYFDVEIKKLKFRMSPVITSTGAIRLEDVHTGAVWLQLSNKSMLMSQKTGSRLADACMSSAQAAVAVAMEKNPPSSLLEPVPVVSQFALPGVAVIPFSAGDSQ